MKKLLLTGGNGFIGSYFYKTNLNQYQIEKFSFLKDDLNCLTLESFDTIIHLSALVHQMGGASTEEYYRVNVKNTLALAKKAKMSGVQHFIYMSSIKVYGEESETIYREDSACFPKDDYGKSKLKAEEELKKLEESNFIVSIVRTPIVYGEGVKANIKNLVTLVNRVPLLPFANINNKRSMVYIGNLCDIISRIIELRKSGIFLASDSRPISTTNLIKLIAKASNKKIGFLPIPFFEWLLKRAKPSFYKRLYMSLEVDNSHTMKVLNLSNNYSMEEGIKLMIQKEEIHEDN